MNEIFYVLMSASMANIVNPIEISNKLNWMGIDVVVAKYDSLDELLDIPNDLFEDEELCLFWYQMSWSVFYNDDYCNDDALSMGIFDYIEYEYNLTKESNVANLIWSFAIELNEDPIIFFNQFSKEDQCH